MDRSDNEIDWDSMPQDGFELPPVEGYQIPRKWLASTLGADRELAFAWLIEAVDPCELAQAMNVEHLERLGMIADDNDRGLVHGAQDMRVRMEFSEDPLVHRVDAVYAGLTTIVQPADHGYAVEDMREYPFGEREPYVRPACHFSTLRTMNQVMLEASKTAALIKAATDHFTAFEEERSGCRIAMSWGGLADALGLAEAVIPDQRFLANFRLECTAAAREMRPLFVDQWVQRSAAYTKTYKAEKESEHLDEG